MLSSTKKIGNSLAHKKTAEMYVLRSVTPLMTLTTDLGLSIRASIFAPFFPVYNTSPQNSVTFWKQSLESLEKISKKYKMDKNALINISNSIT